MRRISALLATGLMSTAAVFAAAPAQAQPNAGAIIRLINSGVATADCTVVKIGLRATGLVNSDTTRGQLVQSLTKATSDDAALRFISVPTINVLGDRALECGAVKPDPVTPISQAIAASSQLSSQAGLPEIRNLLPLFN